MCSFPSPLPCPSVASGRRSGRFGARAHSGRAALAVGVPGLVVAGRLGPTSLGLRRADRTIGAGGTSEIGSVRLPPRPRRDLFLGRRHIDGVVQPAMPGRRHDRGFGSAVVNDPASLEAERRIDLAALRAVIAVAELVLAHELAIEGGPQQRAEGRPIPPGKEAQEKRFHGTPAIGYVARSWHPRLLKSTHSAGRLNGLVARIFKP